MKFTAIMIFAVLILSSCGGEERMIVEVPDIDDCYLHVSKEVAKEYGLLLDDALRDLIAYADEICNDLRCYRELSDCICGCFDESGPEAVDCRDRCLMLSMD